LGATSLSAASDLLQALLNSRTKDSEFAARLRSLHHEWGLVHDTGNLIRKMVVSET